MNVQLHSIKLSQSLNLFVLTAPIIGNKIYTSTYITTIIFNTILLAIDIFAVFTK